MKRRAFTLIEIIIVIVILSILTASGIYALTKFIPESKVAADTYNLEAIKSFIENSSADENVQDYLLAIASQGTTSTSPMLVGTVHITSSKVEFVKQTSNLGLCTSSVNGLASYIEGLVTDSSEINIPKSKSNSDLKAEIICKINDSDNTASIYVVTSSTPEAETTQVAETTTVAQTTAAPTTAAPTTAATTTSSLIDITSMKWYISPSACNWTGSPCNPSLWITGLTKNKDTVLTYDADTTSVGDKHVTLTGIGKYTGSITVMYKVRYKTTLSVPASVTMNVGDTYQFTAVTNNKVNSFVSSDTAILKVTKSGNTCTVTALSAGTATVKTNTPDDSQYFSTGANTAFTVN